MALLWVILALSLAMAFLFSVLFHALRDFSVRKAELLAAQLNAERVMKPILDNADVYARGMGLVRLAANTITIICVALLIGPLMHTSQGQTPAVQSIVWPNVFKAIVLAIALIFLFSQLLPISIAQYAGERFMVRSALLIRTVHFITLPLAPLQVVDHAVKRLAGEANVTEHEELEEDVLSAVTEGERGGRFQAVERDMIEGVIELGEKTAEEIMTPRTDIEGFELTNDLEFIKHFITTAGHSRIPVYEGDLDHILGMLYAKDLIPYVGTPSDDFELRPLLRDTLFVPESKSVNELLVELQHKKVHLAIVIDEYGGTAGLVTFEDILEQVVGEIQDEYEPEEEAQPAVTLDEDQRSAIVEAWASMSDLNESLATIGVHLQEHDDYDTVGGYVMAALGHIPVTGERLERDGAALTILDAEPTRVNRLQIEPLVVDHQGAEEPDTDNHDDQTSK
ncbi:MAG: HlyC/CorC family transporter [Phycisphaerales bacterium]|nr:HlyC/CorC family transporter [Phycisphaerales bacterium]